MKNILNWFKKRTASKILIVMFAACTIGFLIAGMWEPALIEFAFFLSWLALDLKNNTIEVQGKTIRLLSDGNSEQRRKLDMMTASSILLLARYTKEKATADFCRRKIDCSTYIKKLQDAEQITEGADIVVNIVNKSKPQGD